MLGQVAPQRLEGATTAGPLEPRHLPQQRSAKRASLVSHDPDVDGTHEVRPVGYLSEAPEQVGPRGITGLSPCASLIDMDAGGCAGVKTTALQYPGEY